MRLHKVFDVIIISGIKFNFMSYILLKLKVKNPEAILINIHRSSLCSVVSDSLLDPIECGLPGSSVHGFSWQELLELPCPPPGIFPDRGITSPVLADWICY